MEIITAVVSIIGSVLLASASYLFAKKKEREAELRREKLEHYKDFTAAMSGVITGKSTREGQLMFARACNNLNLIAPLSVIKTLQQFQHEIRERNEDRDKDHHDVLMSRVLYEMRKDLGVSPEENLGDFKVGLWAPGEP